MPIKLPRCESCKVRNLLPQLKIRHLRHFQGASHVRNWWTCSRLFKGYKDLSFLAGQNYVNLLISFRLTCYYLSDDLKLKVIICHKILVKIALHWIRFEYKTVENWINKIVAPTSFMTLYIKLQNISRFSILFLLALYFYSLRCLMCMWHWIDNLSRGFEILVLERGFVFIKFMLLLLKILLQWCTEKGWKISRLCYVSFSKYSLWYTDLIGFITSVFG